MKSNSFINIFDLMLILAFMIFFAIVSFTVRDNIILVILGLPFILVFPGYLITLALYPKRHSITLPERIAITFGLSFIMLPSLGLLLNFTPFGISLGPILIGTIVVSILLSLAVWYQRLSIKIDDQFQPLIDIKAGLSELGGKKLGILPAVLVIAIIVVLIGIIYMFYLFAATEQPSEEFTELIILDGNNQMLEKPFELESDSASSITFIVNNYENERFDYLLNIRAVPFTEDWSLNESDNFDGAGSQQPEDGSDIDASVQLIDAVYINDFKSTLILDGNRSYAYNFSLDDDDGISERIRFRLGESGYYQLQLDLFSTVSESEPQLIRSGYFIVLVT